MIHELRQPVKSIHNFDIQFPEVQAIIERNNPGWIFVDDLNEPSAALVWAQGIEGFYLIGDSDSKVFREELNTFTNHELKPRLIEQGKLLFEISGNETWDPVIEIVYRNRVLEKSQQWIYTFPTSMHTLFLQDQLDGHIELKKIDMDLLPSLSAESKKYLLSKVSEFWDSLDAFLRIGFGYVVLVGDEIASLCFSGFVAGNIYVIDIETKESHRRKGYAEVVSQAFVKNCIDMHLHPHWDCMAENTASLRLAEKLGFTKCNEYTLFSFSL